MLGWFSIFIEWRQSIKISLSTLYFIFCSCSFQHHPYITEIAYWLQFYWSKYYSKQKQKICSHSNYIFYWTKNSKILVLLAMMLGFVYIFWNHNKNILIYKLTWEHFISHLCSIHSIRLLIVFVCVVMLMIVLLLFSVYIYIIVIIIFISLSVFRARDSTVLSEIHRIWPKLSYCYCCYVIIIVVIVSLGYLFLAT